MKIQDQNSIFVIINILLISKKKMFFFYLGLGKKVSSRFNLISMD